MGCPCARCLGGRQREVFESMEMLGGGVVPVLVRIDVARCPRCRSETCLASRDHAGVCIEEMLARLTGEAEES